MLKLYIYILGVFTERPYSNLETLSQRRHRTQIDVKINYGSLQADIDAVSQLTDKMHVDILLIEF